MRLRLILLKRGLNLITRKEPNDHQNDGQNGNQADLLGVEATEKNADDEANEQKL